jgi:hypothetical protein
MLMAEGNIISSFSDGDIEKCEKLEDDKLTIMQIGSDLVLELEDMVDFIQRDRDVRETYAGNPAMISNNYEGTKDIKKMREKSKVLLGNFKVRLSEENSTDESIGTIRELISIEDYYIDEALMEWRINPDDNSTVDKLYSLCYIVREVLRKFNDNK